MLSGQGKEIMKRFILLLLLAHALVACTHTDSGSQSPFKAFPATFLTDQTLTIDTPQAKRQLRAQLQRKDRTSGLDLVLIEPMLGIVLARAEIDEKGIQILYMAPQVDEKKLPLQKIGSAIRTLYDSENFLQDGADFVYKVEGGLYQYRLKSIQGPADCRYPAQIHLRFVDQPYDLIIATDSFTCILD
jgi:hypothetical protein